RSPGSGLHAPKTRVKDPPAAAGLATVSLVAPRPAARNQDGEAESELGGHLVDDAQDHRSDGTVLRGHELPPPVSLLRDHDELPSRRGDEMHGDNVTSAVEGAVGRDGAHDELLATVVEGMLHRAYNGPGHSPEYHRLRPFPRFSGDAPVVSTYVCWSTMPTM